MVEYSIQEVEDAVLGWRLCFQYVLVGTPLEHTFLSSCSSNGVYILYRSMEQSFLCVKAAVYSCIKSILSFSSSKLVGLRSLFDIDALQQQKKGKYIKMHLKIFFNEKKFTISVFINFIRNVTGPKSTYE